jgi:hypothetical protein
MATVMVGDVSVETTENRRCNLGWKLFHIWCDEYTRVMNIPEEIRSKKDWNDCRIAQLNYITHQEKCEQCSARNREIAEIARSE